MHSLLHMRSSLDLVSQRDRDVTSAGHSGFGVVVNFISLASAFSLGRLGKDGSGEQERDCRRCRRSMSSVCASSPGLRMSSMESSHQGASGPTWLRSGWIFHKQSIIGKMWRKRWVTLTSDGTLTVANQIKSKRRGRHRYNLQRDCMLVRTAGQCQHMHLPPEVEDRANLIELLLTGDRRLAFCGQTLEDSELWFKCIETARSEAVTPPSTCAGSFRALDDVAEEKTIRCCLVCMRPSSKVKAIDYRPSTKQSTTSSIRRRRRVSWSKHVIMIEE